MQFFAEFKKAEPQADGTLMVYGVASAPVRDAHGEIVTKEAMAGAIEDYMKFPAVREMHDAKAAGTGMEISQDDEGRTVFVAKIVDKDAIDKIRHRVYRGYSIGGRVKQRNSQDHSIISKIELHEISLVDRPSCPAATFNLWKRDDVAKAGDTGDSDTSVWVDQERWNDGFDFFGQGGDRGTSEGPMSLADGGPYRSQTPVRQSDDGSGPKGADWHGKEDWSDGRDFFGQGGDPGRGSFVTDPNAGQVRTTGARNSTVNTAGQRSDTGDRANAVGSLPFNSGNSRSRHTANTGGGASPATDYFTPSPGSPSNLQRTLAMIADLCANVQPPIDDATYVAKRAFTAEQRKKAAKSGAAMNDGSYPIENKDDLANAVRAFGRAKNPAATKAHIKRRAAALGATQMLPSEWGKSAESEGGLNNRQLSPAGLAHIDGDNDPLATKVAKTSDLLKDTLASIERLEVRHRRGVATPEAYRLAKTYQEMPLDELAEVLASDALAKIAASNTKLLDAEELAKRYKADNEALLQKLADTNEGLEQLKARVQKLADMPMPPRTAGSVYAVDKEGDRGGQPAVSSEDLAKAKDVFDAMSEEERVLLLTKMSLSHPRQMNLNPKPAPTRSIGGTAGNPEGERVR
jgi:hypothetical protein